MDIFVIILFLLTIHLACKVAKPKGKDHQYIKVFFLLIIYGMLLIDIL